MTTMNTYFVRHTTGIWIDDETRQRLWKERRIAIHFGRRPHTVKNVTRDSSSIDPDDYTGSGKSCMGKLVELAREGGYVCAQHYPHTEWMVGLVKPRSKIELLKGKWREDCELKGRTAVLKTLRLTRVKLIDPLDYAVLSVGRPRQGTIMRWHLAGKTVESLVEGRRSNLQLSDLAPRQQEIFCSELLRLPQVTSLGLPRLAHLLLPTGHTMRDIDIIGIATDGKALLAQVTLLALDSAALKIDRLLPYRDPRRAHLVFFCDCAESTEEKGVSIFPIRQAYDIFTSTRHGRQWLRRSA